MATEIEQVDKPSAKENPRSPSGVLDSVVVEKLVIGGDLSKLNPAERLRWYTMRCEAAGLDPRTQPFIYMTQQGRLTLYPTKSATDQLIFKRQLSVRITERRHVEVPEVYEVLCEVTSPAGPKVEDLAAVSTRGLHGEALANAVMKCVTKAKRRAVLSACGLGLPDDSEADDLNSVASNRSVPPIGRSRHVEPAVLGQPEGTDIDSRPYHVIVKDAVTSLATLSHTHDLEGFKEATVHGFLANAAIQQGLMDPPRDRKPLTVLNALSGLYEKHRDWVRNTLNDFLDEKVEEVRAADRKEPESDPDPAPAPSPDADEREPGEDG